MKKLWKQTLALLCCLCMALALVPTASAAGAKKVLFIGSDFTNDSIFYLSELAHLAGQDMDVALVEQKGGSFRTLAPAAAAGTALTYYKADASTGYKLTATPAKITVQDALKEQAWDIVVLQPGLYHAALKGNYGADFKYMVDMVEDLASSAKLYWNMPWAVDSNNMFVTFKDYFNKNVIGLYNAILTNTKDFVAANKSFDGIIYTGTAIQNARATALGEKMTRNTQNLTFKQGRLIASLTALKSLNSGANLGKVTVAALDGILTDSGSPADTYVNNEENLKLVLSSVNAACSGTPKLAEGDTSTAPNTNAAVYSYIQVEMPQLLKFPDITVMDNGDVIVSAYENVVHTPTIGDATEGVGSLVFYKSTDNGKTFQKMDFTIDEAQMEKWGICSLSNRYETLKTNPENNYTYYFDPRDPNVKSFHCDVNGDGKKENILFLTFWVRSFNKTNESTLGGTYCTYSTDGGKTWVTPQFAKVGVKRGDVMEFNDGTLLMPTYSGKTVVCSTITFDKSGKMTITEISRIPDGSWDGVPSSGGAEASFISPDGEKTVFTMIRPSGAVLRSDDRGKTWTLIGNEDDEIHQPGFTKIDDTRVFVTWAGTKQPRPIYGKVFYTDGAWTDSATVQIYGKAQSVSTSRDTGDPSCATLKDGKIITVSYDSYYRSLILTVEDPNADIYARKGTTPVTPVVDPIPETGTAFASKQTVDLDGKPTEFDMYMLVDKNGGETNYIKLRDIAYLLNGTQANFEVGYDGTISLTTKKAYTPNGSELKTPFSGNRAYKVCSTTIKVDGKVPSLAGITLTDNDGGEYNYFKLRDLGAALGFNVSWSEARGIYVETNKPYTAD